MHTLNNYVGRTVSFEGTKVLLCSCYQLLPIIPCGIFQGTGTKSQIQICKFQDSQTSKVWGGP